MQARRENLPEITSVFNESGDEVQAGGVVTVDEEIRIVGNNFADSTDANQISFGETEVDANSGAVDELFATVPQLPGHSQSNPLIPAGLTVTVNPDDPDGSQQSAPFNLQVFLSQ